MARYYKLEHPLLVLAACASPARAPSAPQEPARGMQATSIAIADVRNILAMAFDDKRGRLWVAASSGSVVIVDPAAAKVVQRIVLPSTPQPPLEPRGPDHIAIVGDVAFVANDSDYTLCAFDVTRAARLGCAPTTSGVGALVDVGGGELWVTTPNDHLTRVFDIRDPAHLHEVAAFAIPPRVPTGYAVDRKAHRVYAALGDSDVVASYDIAGRRALRSWQAGCGTNGTLDVAVDESSGRLIVACQKQLLVLDADGKRLGALAIDGIARIAYSPARHEVYVPLMAKYRVAVVAVAGGALSLTRTHAAPGGPDTPTLAADGTLCLRNWDRDRVLVIPPDRTGN